MDGDHSGKSLDSGANSATNVQDMTESIHEGAHSAVGQGEKATGQGTSIFSKDGAVGKHFTSCGALGGTADKVGGPFAKDGTIGQHFEADGKVGGTFQELAKKNEQH